MWAADLETHATRVVAKLPGGGGNVTVNAEETRVVVIGADPDEMTIPRVPPPGRLGGRLKTAWAAGTPKLISSFQYARADAHRRRRGRPVGKCRPTGDRGRSAVRECGCLLARLPASCRPVERR